MTDWIMAMAEPDYRKQLGARIKALRKQQKLTQKQLASALGISFGQLNKYESGLNNPSPELLIAIADQLRTSLDMLLTGHRPDDVPVSNIRLIDRLRELQNIDPDDQETVIKLIDALIIKHRAEGLLSPLDKQTA